VSKEKKPTKPSLNKNTLKTAKRLLGYVTKTYKVQFIIVLICILVSYLYLSQRSSQHFRIPVPEISAG